MDVLESARGHKDTEGLGTCERMGELPLFSLENRRLRMTFMCVNTYWVGRKKDEARVLVVPNDRARGSRHKLKCTKFQFLIRKLFFSAYMSRNSLLGEAV